MLDQKVTDALILHDVTAAWEHPDDLVYVNHIESGYHLRRLRSEAEVLIQNFPQEYRLADGPDNIDDETRPWAIYHENGAIVDTSGSLDDPTEKLTDEDRERILAYRAATTKTSRRADRAAIFARTRSRQA